MHKTISQCCWTRANQVRKTCYREMMYYHSIFLPTRIKTFKNKRNIVIKQVQSIIASALFSFLITLRIANTFNTYYISDFNCSKSYLSYLAIDNISSFQKSKKKIIKHYISLVYVHTRFNTRYLFMGSIIQRVNE